MGESTDSGNDAGSDVPDRSNPNEMAARERAAARAGTVTDGKGNPVTSTNPDGTKSVVTSGNATDFERSMAQQQFAAQTGNPLSRSAQNLAESVAERETAALNRAAEAGKLAGAPAGAALANIGQPPAALGVDNALAFTPASITQPTGTGLTDPETARIANLTPDEAAAQGVTVAQQRAAQAAVRGQTVNPVTGAFEGPNLVDIFSEANLDPAAGQEAQRVQNEQDFARRQQTLATLQNNLGISSLPESATAAAVLQGPPQLTEETVTLPDGASIVSQTFDAPGTGRDLMTTKPGSYTPAPASDFLVGQQSSVGRPGLVGTAADGSPITTDEFQSVYVDGRGMSVPRPEMSVINTAAADPMTQLSQQQAIFGLGDNAPQSATSAAAQAAARQLSPLEQSVQAAVDASTRTPEEQAGVTPTGPMGQQAAAGTPAQDFYADAYRELNPDIETIPGEGLFGFTNALGKMSPIGLLTGATSDPASAADQAAFQSGQLLSMGGTMDPETGAISDVPAGRGTLNMNRFGMVTYSGMPDPNYDGPYANLVNPPADTGGDGGQQMQQATADPCPEGYQMRDGVCQPVDDLIQPPDPPGSDFVINPTTGLPTLFQPTTQATQVGQINPFVLQPYTPVQAQNIQQARSGIQALSPTGAALGRQV